MGRLKKPWSFSSLTAFETCPWRYYLTRVKKSTIEPETDAQSYGNAVHKHFELRVKDGKPLPDFLGTYEGMIEKIINSPGNTYAEQELAVTSAYSPAGWWAKDAWCRGIVDLTKVNGSKAAAWDYKTGKRKPDSSQLMLFAGLIFAHYPEVTRVQTGFLWLKDGKVDKDVFTRDNMATIWGEFIPRVQRLEIAVGQGKWPKRPSGLCARYCPVGRAHCEYCGT